MIEELDRVVLTADIAEYDLKAGDIGAVVMAHNEGAGFEVEFIAFNDETLAVIYFACRSVGGYGGASAGKRRSVDLTGLSLRRWRRILNN